MDTISIPRYRRGDPSPVDAGLVFYRLTHGKPRWVTPEKLASEIKKIQAGDKIYRVRPEVRERLRVAADRRNQRPEMKAYHSAYYKRADVKERNREARREAARRHAKTEKGKASQKRTREKNKEKIRIRCREYHRKKRKNPVHHLEHMCRNRIRIALICQGVRKNSRTAKMLGCSFEFFKGWIKAQFKDGMTFDNIGNKPGQWQIDHIIPIARFNLANEDERNRAFHYTNCAPEWAEINQRKSDSIEGELFRGRHYTRQQQPNVIQFAA